jgi:hypothetical protein
MNQPLLGMAFASIEACQVEATPFESTERTPMIQSPWATDALSTSTEGEAEAAKVLKVVQAPAGSLIGLYPIW